jgi:hypothetical protein
MEILNQRHSNKQDYNFSYIIDRVTITINNDFNLYAEDMSLLKKL